MFGPNKVSKSLIDAVLQVTEGKSDITQDPQLLDEASEKVPTPTGMKVYGSRYGDSKKARVDQLKRPVDSAKGPKDKDLKEDDLEETGLRKAAYAAHKSGQTMFKFKGKTYPVKIRGEEVEAGDEIIGEDGDCVTKPQAKTIAKGEVKKHEKKMHEEEIELDEAPKHMANINKEVQRWKNIKRDIKWGPDDPLDSRSDIKSKIKGTAKTNKALKQTIAGTKHKHSPIPEETEVDQPMSFKDRLLERAMTDAETKKKEKIVMSMKDKQSYFKKKYGKRWKEVMYATATKQAMNETMVEEEQIDEFKEYPQSVRNDDKVPGAHINKPNPKLKTGKEFKEDVEELDELTAKKAAGGSYAQKKKELIAKASSLVTKEEVKKSDVPAFLRKLRGDKPLTAKDVKGAPKGSISHPDNLAKARNEEVEEDVEVIQSKNPHKITTDMLSGREKGGKLNSFKNFKVNLVTSGEEDIPKELDKGEDTKEKQKITTNPGPVDVKLDDKLTTPPHKYFSNQKSVTSEEVRGELKHIRAKEKSERNKEVGEFSSKVVQAEAKDPHMDAGVGSQPDFATEKVIAGVDGWKKVTKNVKDKSGAVHTPMSRAKDLARQAFKKVKSEMLGKAPGNN